MTEFNAKRVLADALLAGKAELIEEMSHAPSEPRATAIRKEIEACESLLRRLDRMRAA